MAKTLSRYRGCLFGALAGDCIGFIYEFTRLPFKDETNAEAYKNIVYNTVINLSKENSKTLIYTDDTAMARSLAKSLLENNGFKAEQLAQLFSETYYTDKLTIERGYGCSVPAVFEKLKSQNYSDPFGPAKHQFGGSGSYGNGAAMRVAPVGLYFANDLTELINVAKLQSLITHSHPDAVMGAVLIAVAVHIALMAEKGTLKRNDFMTKLLDTIVSVEKEIYQTRENPYRKKFSEFSQLVQENSSTFKVSRTLGNNVSALGSVPASIFSFVKFLEPVDSSSFKEDSLNPLTRTIAYAISLHGDTDTIATMAGAIAGAYYGDEYFPDDWANTFEGFEDYAAYAKALFQKNSH